jgi:hypothetical protein
MPKIFCALLAMLALTPLARAQDGEDFTNERPNRPVAPTRASLPGRGSGDVELAVRSFGVGNITRPGEWVGVWMEVKDKSDKPRNVMLRLANQDIDGDAALMQRVIVTNPGSTQLVWLYLHIPFASQDTIEIGAFEGLESGGTGGGDQQQYVPGRMLGSYRYQINQRQTEPIGIGLIGVIGGKTAGLEQYRWVADPHNDHAITGHELTELIQGLSISNLPDRWYGFAPMQAIVWTSAATEDNPLNMREQQAEAIREYVKRGGHFVVVLPPVGQNWVAQPTNPLADIMPAVKVTRTEGVNLDVYRSLFTRDTFAELPGNAVVHSFTPGGTSGVWGPPDAVQIMTGPDGDCVVARRLVGSGMVTVIGIDVASDKLHLKSKAFMTEQFWNRILGKRMRIPTQAELAAAAKGGTMPNGEKPDVYDTQGAPQRIDLNVVSQAVNNEGSAATGLLLACVVFVGYWLVAGPVGYFVLKQRNWKQHAWVGFVAATGVFTAIAWGGANVLKPRRVHGKHLTIVEGVYGQTSQTARSWMGLFLPRYGEQELSVAAPTGVGGGDWKNLIATWDPASSAGGATFASFPDARGYVMDVRAPDTAAFPSRATTKQIQVDWAGVLPANWSMPHPVADTTVSIGKEIRILDRPNWKAPDLKWMIEGTLVHGLPAPLKNVTIIVVREPTYTGLEGRADGLRRRMSRQQLPEWKPGDPLVLDTIFNKSGSEDSSVRDMLRRIVPPPSTMNMMAEHDYPDGSVGVATALMDMADPPEANSKAGNRMFLQRSSTHGLDLSKWMTEPCVIVIGELGSDRGDDVECPIPVRVDGMSGDEVRQRVKGRTIVRWVYPLEAMPFTTYQLVPPAVPPGTSGGGGTGGNGAEGTTP